MKRIIINADDFGMSRVFNEVILELLEKELIKSTSALVTWGLDSQLDQIGRLKEIMAQKDISIGLHFESDEKNTANVIKNLEAQNGLFIKYFGFKPTHIDEHKSITSKEEAEAMVGFAVKNDIYIRNYFPDYAQEYNKIITSNHFILLMEKSVADIEEVLLNELQNDEVMEIIAHPGKFDSDCGSSLNKDRKKDYEKIVELVSFLKENQIALVNQKL